MLDADAHQKERKTVTATRVLEAQATPRCPVCDGDGWYASPSFADAGKTKILIQKVACPRGCPNRNNEPDVLPTARPQ